MRKVPLKRRGGMYPTPEQRSRRKRNVAYVLWLAALVIAARTTLRGDWQGALKFVAVLVGALLVLTAMHEYVTWPVQTSRDEPPPIQDWAVSDTPPSARVYRGHPRFMYETHAEAVERRLSGTPDTKLQPSQPRASRMQRRGGRGLFVVKRKPYETELEAAMEKMLERRRGDLETCDSPAALITEVLIEAMGGDQPADEVRDWFVNTVLARVESDRHMARLPSLDEARAKWKGRL